MRKFLRYIADFKQNILKEINFKWYFNSSEWEIVKLPYRYLFSAQFKGILTLIILMIGVQYYIGEGNLKIADVLGGAAIMRFLTLNRYY